jgi:hypothetical protein
VLTLLSSLQAGSQDISGRYYNQFGCKLELFSDSSYSFSYHFDLSSSWSKGKWTIFRDTLLLNNTPIYDTLTVTDTNWTSNTLKTYSINTKEELVLSSDDKPGKISKSESIINSISGGGQNRLMPPGKMVIKKGKLYLLDKNGRLDRKKIDGILSNKKYKTYYQKDKQTST